MPTPLHEKKPKKAPCGRCGREVINRTLLKVDIVGELACCGACAKTLIQYQGTEYLAGPKVYKPSEWDALMATKPTRRST